MTCGVYQWLGAIWRSELLSLTCSAMRAVRQRSAWPTVAAFGLWAATSAQSASTQGISGPAWPYAHGELRGSRLLVPCVTDGGLFALQARPTTGGPSLYWRVPIRGQLGWWSAGSVWTAYASVMDLPEGDICELSRVSVADDNLLAVAPETTWRLDDQVPFNARERCRYDDTMWPFYLYAVPARKVNRMVDVSFDGPDTLLAFVRDDRQFVIWRRSMTDKPEVGMVTRAPGNWRRGEAPRWPNTQPFRVLPTAHHWYFLTADNKLWQTPRQGEPNREVKEIWAAGDKKIQGTIIDHDISRSFVFGDGWYLDLGDEMKKIAEPADKPWPRPGADAPEIERLRVWRGWVDLTNPPPL